MQRRFLEAVQERIHPTMVAWGFVHNVSGVSDRTDVTSVLYEMDPGEFARRFPALKEHFGTDVAPCIDILITYDARTGEIDRRLGDLGALEDWFRDAKAAAQAGLIWRTDADIADRIDALAEALDANVFGASAG
jgi:hypothetical protein